MHTGQLIGSGSDPLDPDAMGQFWLHGCVQVCSCIWDVSLSYDTQAGEGSAASVGLHLVKEIQPMQPVQMRWQVLCTSADIDR